MAILDLNQSYTFSKYFEMNISPQDFAQEFDYTFSRKYLNLPPHQEDLEQLKELQDRLSEILPYVDLTNGTSRRQLLISPVLLDLVHYTKSKVRIEYPIKVNEQLQGDLDYLIKNQHNLLVVEAKKQDLGYGMTQLFAELIALDKCQENPHQTHIIGVVTTGHVWQFAQLDSTNKHLDQGLELYRVPDDLDPLMRILVQALIG